MAVSDSSAWQSALGRRWAWRWRAAERKAAESGCKRTAASTAGVGIENQGQHSSTERHLVFSIACAKLLPALEEVVEDSEVGADCRAAGVLLRHWASNKQSTVRI